MCCKESKDETGCGCCPQRACKRKKKKKRLALIAERKEQKTSGEVKTAFYWGRKKPRKLHGRSSI